MNQEPARSDEQLDLILLARAYRPIRAVRTTVKRWLNPREHCIECEVKIPPGKADRKCQACRKKEEVK